MALPAKAKTWLYDFHQIASTSNIDWHREALFRFVDKMLTLGSNPWIVRYSGDGTTVGVAGDGVNRWAAETDLNWSSGNHSWMVLENVDGVQVLFDLDFSSGQAYRMNALMSQSEGFTGGTISVRPTATDEVALPNTNWSGNQSALDGVIWIHQSDDGEVTRLFTMIANVCTGFVCIEKLKDPTAQAAGATNSYLFANAKSNSEAAGVATSSSFLGSSIGWEASDGFDATAITLTGTAFNAGLTIDREIGSQRTGASFLVAQGVWGLSSGLVGARGNRFDAYWAPTPPAQNGDTYPNDATRQFVQIGHWVLPHDGSIPVTS